MAEIQRVKLQQAPDALNSLDVSILVVLTDGGDGSDWCNEGVRCLDWALNHQLRRARKYLAAVPIFVPAMGKIRASYVVLCSERSDLEILSKNFNTMGLKSLAIVSDEGEIPERWSRWDNCPFSSIYLCDWAVDSEGGVS